MSDHSLTTMAPMDDIELITRFLNHQLDDATAEQVRARLQNDPEFYNLAEPLLFAWSVPRHVDRHPRPDGELEEMWDKFTRRHGFVHQRQRARRRRLWIIGFVALAIGVSVFTVRDKLARAYRDWRDFEIVQADTGWVMLRDSNSVRLAPGARLWSSKRVVDGMHRLKLEGSARFRVFAGDTAVLSPATSMVRVETRGGLTFCGRCEFTVSTRGDTTDVEVHHPSKRRYLGFVPMASVVLVSTRGEQGPLSLGETQTARLIRGGRAERTRR